MHKRTPHIMRGPTYDPSPTQPTALTHSQGVKATMAVGGYGFGMVIADTESNEKATLILNEIPVFKPTPGAPFETVCCFVGFLVPKRVN